MKDQKQQIFLSYSVEDSFTADLLQRVIEAELADLDVFVWRYQRDQASDQKQIALSLKENVKNSKATVFLVSPQTLNSGAAQWIELAYSDAFEVPTFIVLHRVSYQDLKAKEKGVPPLLLDSQCNTEEQWRTVLANLRERLTRTLITHP